MDIMNEDWKKYGFVLAVANKNGVTFTTLKREWQMFPTSARSVAQIVVQLRMVGFKIVSQSGGEYTLEFGEPELYSSPPI